jgi:hypothetical protein
MRARLTVVTIAVAVVAAAAGVVLGATPAVAVPGRVVVTATGASDSTSPKAVSAACPPGTVALGGGAKINGAAHHVRLVRSAPVAGVDWVASASEDSYGYAGDWSLTTWVICAPAPAGYQIVTVTTASAPGTPFAFASAPCPAGTKVIGAGGNAFNGSSVLELLAPSLSLTSVVVQAAPDEVAYPTPGQMMVTAIAICVAPLPGQQLVQVDGAWGSPSTTTLIASCPAASVLHGLGFGIGTGVVPWNETQLVGLFPSRAGATLAAEEDSTGNAGDWIAHVYAIVAHSSGSS